MIGADDQARLAATRVTMTLPDPKTLMERNKTRPHDDFQFYGHSLLALIDAPQEIYGSFKGKIVSLCLSCTKEKSKNQDEGGKPSHATVVVFKQALPDMGSIYRHLPAVIEGERDETVSFSPGSKTLQGYLSWQKDGNHWYMTNLDSKCLLITNDFATLPKQQAPFPVGKAKTAAGQQQKQENKSENAAKLLPFQEKLNTRTRSWIFTGADSTKGRPAILVQLAGSGEDLTVEALTDSERSQDLAARQFKAFRPLMERSAGAQLEEMGALQLKLPGNSEELRKSQHSLLVEMNPYLACKFGL